MLILPASQSESEELQSILNAAFDSNARYFPEDMEEDEDSGEELTIRSALYAEDIIVLAFWEGILLLGGAIIRTGEQDINYLERLFILPQFQRRGLGYQAWLCIERLYPCKGGWRLRTPTCLINNVCFYVNRCGFAITCVEDMGNDGVGMFVFTKASAQDEACINGVGN